MNVLLEINISGPSNSKDIFDYVILIISAMGSVATAIALWYVYKQFKMAEVQQFETKFFQLLGLHKQLLDDIQKDDPTLFLRAKNEISTLFINYDHDEFGSTKIQNIHFNNVEEFEQSLKERYHTLYYHQFEDKFNHYLRNLYQVFKLIHESKAISNKDRKQYAAIARAQLSQNELLIIFYNSMVEEYGYPKFLYLIKEYEVLQNFRSKDLKEPMAYKYFQSLIAKIR